MMEMISGDAFDELAERGSATVVRIHRPFGDPPAFALYGSVGELLLCYPFDSAIGKGLLDMLGPGSGDTYHKMVSVGDKLALSSPLGPDDPERSAFFTSAGEAEE
jgi:hypothetical protein